MESINFRVDKILTKGYTEIIHKGHKAGFNKFNDVIGFALGIVQRTPTEKRQLFFCLSLQNPSLTPLRVTILSMTNKKDISVKVGS